MSEHTDAIAAAHASARHHWRAYRYHEDRVSMAEAAGWSTDRVKREQEKAEINLALSTCFRSVVGMLKELDS